MILGSASIMDIQMYLTEFSTSLVVELAKLQGVSISVRTYLQVAFRNMSIDA